MAIPSKPYWVNHPWRRADGSVAEDDRFYEVVGHRDGPVVARFYWYDEETEKKALEEATALCDRNGQPEFHAEFKALSKSA